MSCLTPEGAISGECDFLSANMYARSLFGTCCLCPISYYTSWHDWDLLSFVGEDALANLSVERTEAGTIIGHVRIRSKTQGIALSLGDRITMGEYCTLWDLWLWLMLMISLCSTKREQASCIVCVPRVVLCYRSYQCFYFNGWNAQYETVVTV